MSVLFDLMILFGGSLPPCDTQPTCKVANWALFQRDFHHSKFEGRILLGHYHMFHIFFIFAIYIHTIFYLTLPYFCSTDVVHTFFKWMKCCQEFSGFVGILGQQGPARPTSWILSYPTSAESETVVVSVVGLESQEPLL